MNDDFDPVEEGTVTDDASAYDKGTYRLKVKDKTAVSTDGELTVKLPKDIRVKVFRVTYPDSDRVGTDSYWMAYQTENQEESEDDTEVHKARITKLRFEPFRDDPDVEEPPVNQR